MKSLISIFACVLVTGSSISAFAQGGQGGRGGFAYKKSITLLEAAQKDSIAWLSQFNEKCINNKLADHGLAPVRVPRMIQAIKNLRMSFKKNLESVNPAGDRLPLMFTIGSDPNTGVEYIEALQPYFVAYMSNAYAAAPNFLLSYRTGIEWMYTNSAIYLASTVPLREVDLLLFHEASHLFGYSELDGEELETAMAELRSSGCK